MIELKNLSFSYENSSEAKGQLRGIDLHVKKGELVILSGRSGCGKTTLTRILNGLCPGFYPGKLEGGYSLDGEDALKLSQAADRRGYRKGGSSDFHMGLRACWAE